MSLTILVVLAILNLIVFIAIMAAYLNNTYTGGTSTSTSGYAVAGSIISASTVPSTQTIASTSVSNGWTRINTLPVRCGASIGGGGDRKFDASLLY